MKHQAKRITAAVTPDVAAIYNKLAEASSRTLSSVVNDVLASRAWECLYFLHWLHQQSPGSTTHEQGCTAVDQLARTSLVDAIRAIHPTYRTASDIAAERQQQGEALLKVLEEHEAAKTAPESVLAALAAARAQVDCPRASARGTRWRDRDVVGLDPSSLFGSGRA